MPDRIGRSTVVLTLCLACAVAVSFLPAFAADGDIPAQADGACKAGEYAAAKSLYQQLYAESGLINDTPEQKALNAHLLLRLGCCCCFLSGQQGQARDLYSKAIELYPTNTQVCADAQNGIAESYAQYGQRDLAIENWELMIARYPEERGLAACALLEIAEDNLRIRRYVDSATTLTRMLRDYPDKRGVCSQARLLLAEALYEQDKTDEAIGVINQTIDGLDCSAEEKGEALVRLGFFQLHADRHPAAKTTCERILSDYAGSDRFTSAAKWLLIQVMCEDGSDPTATLALVNEMRSSAICREPSSRAQLSLWESGLLWAKGDANKAEECLTRMTVDYADNTSFLSEVYCHRACLYIALKQFDKATADIDRIGTPYLRFFALGEWHYQQQNHADAVVNYEKMLTVLPDNRVPNNEPLRAFRRLATAYSVLGQADKEAATLQRLAAYEAAHK